MNDSRYVAARGTTNTRSTMPTRVIATGLAAAALLGFAPAQAQVSIAGPQVQIPSLQVCNKSALTASKALIGVERRMPGGYAGTATLQGRVLCDPIAGNGYPSGALGLYGVDMNDNSIPQGADIVFTSQEQVTSSGRATPTIWINGRCEVRKGTQVLTEFNGCRYWLMATDNKDPQQTATGKTPDIVSFMVFGKLGRRIAYGTGPVVEGDLVVQPSPL